MKKNNLKKGIVNAGLVISLATGSVVIDNANITDAEIRASIEKATTEGKIPLIDLSKVSGSRIATGYLQVAMKNGVNIEAKNLPTNDVYDLIREEKKKKGKKVAPRTKQTLKVK